MNIHGGEVEVVPVETLREGSGLPLFCVHPGAGVSWPYHALGNYLDCPIIGIQQILDGDEAEPRSIRDMAKNYADRIQRIDLAGPYRLLGWSFGGVVAHELAIELRRRGSVVTRLILLDTQPTTDSDVALPDRALVEKELREAILRRYREVSPEMGEAVTYEQLEEVIRGQGTVVFERYKQLLNLVIQNFNSNFALRQAHNPDVFDGDIVIFSAVRDGSDPSSSPVETWRPYVIGDIAVHSIDCEHGDMLSGESLSIYGKQLNLSLEA